MLPEDPGKAEGQKQAAAPALSSLPSSVPGWMRLFLKGSPRNIGDKIIETSINTGVEGGLGA